MKKSNLQKIRDILNNENSFVRVGYTPIPEIKHKDNDVWVDKDGIEWIQKGPSKISKKLYETREATRQICTACKKDIYWSSNYNDQKFFNKTGKCYDCIIESEHNMRIDGTFETYEKIKVIRNQKSFLSELKQKIEESINWLRNKSNKIEYLNEDGSRECWTDVSRDTFLESAQRDLIEINKSLILCDESILMLENK